MNNIEFRVKHNGEFLYGFMSAIDRIEVWNKKKEDFDTHVLEPLESESWAMYTGLKDNTKWDELTEQEQKQWINRCGIIDWLDADKPETEWDGKRIFGSIPIDGEMSKGGNILKIYDEYTDRILEDGSGPTEPFYHLVEVYFNNGCFVVDIENSGDILLNRDKFPLYEIIDKYLGQEYIEIIGNQCDY